MTPYYQRDNIQIFCGECSEVLSTFEPQSFDLTVTSPPYDNLRDYNGFTFDFDPIARQLWRVTKQGGVVVWVVGDQTKDGSESGTSFRQALGFMDVGFNLHDTMIYQKGNGGANGSQYCYLQSFEYMFVFSNGRPRVINLIQDRRNAETGIMFKRQGRRNKDGTKKSKRRQVRKEFGRRFNIWKLFTGTETSEHPAIFPEALARDHIISWSNAGDLVLDPMCGSGTTGKMAQQLGRRCVLIDTSEEYCKIAVERLSQPTFWSLPVTTEEQRHEQAILL